MSSEKTENTDAKKEAGFASDVLKLVSGTIFAQAITLIAAPIITRYYPPEAYGVWTLFASVTGIAGVIACLRYEMAILLPQNDDEAANILGLCLVLSLMTSLTMFPFFWFGKKFIALWLKSPELANYLLLVPIAVFIGSITVILNYWNSRIRHFERLSIARGTNSLAATALIIGLGLVGRTSAGSMIGSGIVSQTISTSIVGSQMWRSERQILLRGISWRAMKEYFIRYKNFPVFDSWASLMNTVSVQLPPLLLASFFSSTVVGFYALGHRLLSIPISLIGSAISQVFFQRAAAAKNTGNLPIVIRATLMRLMALGVFPLIVVMVIGKDIFGVIFGSQWAESGVYAQIMAPWIIFVFLGSPISMLFSVLEMQSSYLVFNLMLLITRIAALLAGGLAQSIFLALALYASSGAILWMGLCLYLFFKAGLSLRDLITDVSKVIKLIIIALAPLLAAKGYIDHSAIIVLVGTISVIIYYAILYYSDRNLRQQINNQGKKILNYFES